MPSWRESGSSHSGSGMGSSMDAIASASSNTVANNSLHHGNSGSGLRLAVRSDVGMEQPSQGEESERYKYYCPICMMFFQSILRTMCCNQYICEFCLREFVQEKDKKFHEVLIRQLMSNQFGLLRMPSPRSVMSNVSSPAAGRGSTSASASASSMAGHSPRQGGPPPLPPNNTSVEINLPRHLHLDCPYCTAALRIEPVRSSDEVRSYADSPRPQKNAPLRTPPRVGATFEELRRKMVGFDQLTKPRSEERDTTVLRRTHSAPVRSEVQMVRWRLLAARRQELDTVLHCIRRRRWRTDSFEDLHSTHSGIGNLSPQALRPPPGTRAGARGSMRMLGGSSSNLRVGFGTPNENKRRAGGVERTLHQLATINDAINTILDGDEQERVANLQRADLAVSPPAVRSPSGLGKPPLAPHTHRSSNASASAASPSGALPLVPVPIAAAGRSSSTGALPRRVSIAAGISFEIPVVAIDQEESTTVITPLVPTPRSEFSFVSGPSSSAPRRQSMLLTPMIDYRSAASLGWGKPVPLAAVCDEVVYSESGKPRPNTAPVSQARTFYEEIQEWQAPKQDNQRQTRRPSVAGTPSGDSLEDDLVINANRNSNNGGSLNHNSSGNNSSGQRGRGSAQNQQAGEVRRPREAFAEAHPAPPTPDRQGQCCQCAIM